MASLKGGDIQESGRRKGACKWENGELSRKGGKGRPAGVSGKRTRKGSWRPVVEGLVYSSEFGLYHRGSGELLKTVQQGSRVISSLLHKEVTE